MNNSVISAEAIARGYILLNRPDESKQRISGLCERPNKTRCLLIFDYTTSKYSEMEVEG